MEKININIADESNIKDILKIQQESCEELLSEEVIKSEINDSNFIYLIAYIDDEPVAYVASSYVLDTMDLMAILVIPKYRKNKIATKLLNSMINFCNKENIKSIILEVRINNVSAIKLYSKFNFKLISIRNKYYKTEDALIYKLDL